MKKLIVETEKAYLELKDVGINDIQVEAFDNGMGIIRFGNKAAVNLEQFIKYEFVERKDDCNQSE